MVEVRRVAYAANGTTMVGRLALPDGGGPAPAVLVAHEANGLDEYQADRARRLAELGYVALAMDYHGDGRVFTDREAMMTRLGALGADTGRMRGIGRAALDVLCAEPRTDPTRVAAVGYCFGAVLVLELARAGADLKAVVGFHPGDAPHDPGDSRNITGSVLLCVGADDPIFPAGARAALEEELRRAGVPWELHLYGGVVHSFTHPNADRAGLPGLAYDERAARHSWAAMLELFADVLA